MHSLRFRQIHLDFHTSEAIPGIAEQWDPRHWQKVLTEAAVDSVNIFATCHHGWSYYDSQIGPRHPHLPFDLMRAQYDACKEVGIKAVLYMTVGVNNLVADQHPEWRCMAEGGWLYGWATKTTSPGFHNLCFNTPYLDRVCAQVQELATSYPDADGLWLDIIHNIDCCCRWCLRSMVARDLDPTKPADRQRNGDLVLDEYYRRVLAALRAVHPTMPIFQNSGHIGRGKREFFGYVTHLEIESLPTWGWGYDHFPMSASYARRVGMPFLGMTGKFHTSWGEFGGFKTANALRYECAAMLAHGARCSIGDQLHPDGRLDESTYRIIGQAYREVAAKEPWCVGAEHVVDIGVLSSTAVNPAHPREDDADTGACRLLLEGHFLFDLIDAEMAFEPYRLLILPDEVVIDARLKAKLDVFVAQGGQLLLTGTSGLDTQLRPLFEIGADLCGTSTFEHHYILPATGLRPPLVDSPIIMYDRAQNLRVTSGTPLGVVHDLYFNRTWRHFCSHQHAPAQPSSNGYACGVRSGAITYLPFRIFTCYAQWGAVAYREFAHRLLRSLLAGGESFAGNLPSTARVTMTRQSGLKRSVVHLLYAPLVTRGAPHQTHGVGANAVHATQVIDDLPDLTDLRIAVRVTRRIGRVTFEPQGREVPFLQERGVVTITVDRFSCHQMVVMHDA
ncbi:MAG: alpha-L-fucosidase [Planctomycetes bacterium]|nr:alpha-L-fucosidase [Planctomycetota bacterium]